MRVHLANELAARGFVVDLVLARATGPYRDLVADGVRVLELGTSHAVFGVPRLAAYLRRRRPQVLLTQRIRVQALAERARTLARVPTHVVVTANTQLSRHFASMAPAKAATQRQRMQHCFPRADRILAVSRGVATDLAHLLGTDPDRIPVVPNPVVTPALAQARLAPVGHPWLQPGRETPTVVAVGRLVPQKDFATLLRAFARLRESTAARLLILGEGTERPALVRLAEQLGIREHVDLPGFVANPYAWLARGNLFVLSSAWEGLGNALIEALALGVPAVCTDCASGPGEILEGHTAVPLVHVGDDQALAHAMQRVLAAPPAGHELEHVAEPYRLANSVDRYVAALSLDAHTGGLR